MKQEVDLFRANRAQALGRWAKIAVEAAMMQPGALPPDVGDMAAEHAKLTLQYLRDTSPAYQRASDVAARAMKRIQKADGIPAGGAADVRRLLEIYIYIQAINRLTKSKGAAYIERWHRAAARVAGRRASAAEVAFVDRGFKALEKLQRRLVADLEHDQAARAAATAFINQHLNRE